MILISYLPDALFDDDRGDELFDRVDPEEAPFDAPDDVDFPLVDLPFDREPADDFDPLEAGLEELDEDFDAVELDLLPAFFDEPFPRLEDFEAVPLEDFAVFAVADPEVGFLPDDDLLELDRLAPRWPPSSLGVNKPVTASIMRVSIPWPSLLSAGVRFGIPFAF